MNILDLALQYQIEFLTLSVIAIMMAISPGADFILVTRNSLSASRKSGLYTAFGITIGIWVHVSYCIAGLAVAINTSPTIFFSIKFLGAAYLVYIGMSSFNEKFEIQQNNNSNRKKVKATSALLGGFLSNSLNPKTTLFFLGIFTQLVTEDTPISIQLIYGFIISLAHLLWFSILTYLLTHRQLLPLIRKYQDAINHILGTLLIILGLKILLLSIPSSITNEIVYNPKKLMSVSE